MKMGGDGSGADEKLFGSRTDMPIIMVSCQSRGSRQSQGINGLGSGDIIDDNIRMIELAPLLV